MLKRKKLILLFCVGALLSLVACEKEHVHNLVKHEAKAQTCSEKGHNAYEECSECDYTTFVAIDELDHELVLHEETNSTCSVKGIVKHYSCKNCEKLFEDNEGKKELTQQEVEKSLNECVDEDSNHKCDYNCDKALSECLDEDKDHVCDYNCDKVLSECLDEDKDHVCDYNCDNVLSECLDEDKDHVCDYNCDKALSECLDEDKDHVCDYNCDKVLSECVDEDNNHKCDYNCDKVLSECVDKQFDGLCDLCNKEFDYVIDEENDKFYVFNHVGLYKYAENGDYYYNYYSLVLMNDIYLPKEMNMDLNEDGVNESNWEPIYNFFTIDGNGHSITGLTVINPERNVGFINQNAEGTVIKDLHLKDVNLSGESVGGISVYNYGSIINCSVTGTMKATSTNDGGIAGYNGGNIIGCVNYSNISTESGAIGGIAGQMNGGLIINSCNLGEINGKSSTGGIVGSFYNGDIISTYNFGKVNSESNEVGYITGYGAGNYKDVYWVDLEDDTAILPNRNQEKEGCIKLDNTEEMWIEAMNTMNNTILEYNTNQTIICEYRFAVNSDEATKAIQPLIIVRSE